MVLSSVVQSIIGQTKSAAQDKVKQIKSKSLYTLYGAWQSPLGRYPKFSPLARLKAEY